jgi:hypothetical protein
MRTALISVLCRRPRPAFCDDLFIDGAEPAAPPAYTRLLAADEIALRLHYHELYPSGPALMREASPRADATPPRLTASG